MIGLEYICGLYNKKFSTLAEELGISRQVVNGWIKSRRKISIKYIPKLVEMFNVEEEYFQKELDDVDQIEIQQKKIRNELIEYKYESTFIDDEGEEITITETQPDEEQLYENNFLEFKKNIIRLHNIIDGTIGSKFRNGVIDGDISLNADLFEAEHVLELYEIFVGIIKRGKISRYTMEKVLRGIKHYEGQSLSSEKDILTISGLIKQIEGDDK